MGEYQIDLNLSRCGVGWGSTVSWSTQPMPRAHLQPKDSFFLLSTTICFTCNCLSTLIVTTHTHFNTWTQKKENILKTYKLLYSVLSVHFQGCFGDSRWRPIQWPEDPLFLFRKVCQHRKWTLVSLFQMILASGHTTAPSRDNRRVELKVTEFGAGLVSSS